MYYLIADVLSCVFYRLLISYKLDRTLLPDPTKCNLYSTGPTALLKPFSETEMLDPKKVGFCFKYLYFYESIFKLDEYCLFSIFLL